MLVGDEYFEKIKPGMLGVWGGSCKLNRVLKKGLPEKVTFVQRLDSGEGRRSGGQLFQAEGTVRAKALRQECARCDGAEQGGMVGAEGTRRTRTAAHVFRKITGARPGFANHRNDFGFYSVA